jgi:hypothetical protein
MMNVRRIASTRGALIACGAALLCAAGTVLADEPARGTHPPVTKEQREEMAQAHEKMAACLRSDRAIEECHSEMMKSHDAMMHAHPKMEQTTAPPAPK